MPEHISGSWAPSALRNDAGWQSDEETPPAATPVYTMARYAGLIRLATERKLPSSHGPVALRNDKPVMLTDIVGWRDLNRAVLRAEDAEDLATLELCGQAWLA